MNSQSAKTEHLQTYFTQLTEHFFCSNLCRIALGSVADNDLLLGYLLCGKTPQRNLQSKYYISESEYPEETYPNYLAGGPGGCNLGLFLADTVCSLNTGDRRQRKKQSPAPIWTCILGFIWSSICSSTLQNLRCRIHLKQHLQQRARKLAVSDYQRSSKWSCIDKGTTRVLLHLLLHWQSETASSYAASLAASLIIQDCKF